LAEGRRRRDVADARNDSICRPVDRHYVAIRGKASRAVFWILLPIGLINAGIAIYRLSGL
jgi:hypothetical protein